MEKRDTLFQRLHNPRDSDELADSAVEAADEIEQLKKVVARQWELLGRAEDMLNPGREHRMYMDGDCGVCVLLGQIGDLTLEPPRLSDGATTNTSAEETPLRGA